MRYYKKNAFRKETYYLLNHFTLQVSSPEIKKEIDIHHSKQISRILKPWFFYECFIWTAIIGKNIESPD